MPPPKRQPRSLAKQHTENAGQPSLFVAADPDVINAQARSVFRAFKTGATTNVLVELEQALRELVFRYSVSNQENRFVVGLAAELLIAAAMRACGIDVDNVGETASETDFDIYVEKVRHRISVKSSFTPGQRTIRLVNYLGGTERKPAIVPTIFLLPGVGMVYGDSSYSTLAEALAGEKDASVIQISAVRRHAAEHPESVITLKVPINERTGTRVASREVARSIVNSHGYPSLGRWLRPEPSPRLAAEVRAEISKYQELQKDGALTKKEFESAKADLLRLLDSPN